MATLLLLLPSQQPTNNSNNIGKLKFRYQNASVESRCSDGSCGREGTDGRFRVDEGKLVSISSQRSTRMSRHDVLRSRLRWAELRIEDIVSSQRRSGRALLNRLAYQLQLGAFALRQSDRRQLWVSFFCHTFSMDDVCLQS